MARPADPRRRETILRAATELFTEHSFSDTRLADIAERAGVVISTLYLYFDSKEEMVHAIARENQQSLLQQLRPVLEQLRGEKDIAQFVEIVCTFAKEHRAQIKVFNLDSGLSAVRTELYSTHNIRMLKGKELIKKLIDEGYVRPYDPELVMEMLITMMRWVVTQCLSMEEEEEEQFKRFCVEWLCNALLRTRGSESK